MLRWEKKICQGLSGYLSDFEYPVMRITWSTNIENHRESGFLVSSINLPFSINKIYYQDITEAKSYAEEVLQEFIRKIARSNAM